MATPPAKVELSIYSISHLPLWKNGVIKNTENALLTILKIVLTIILYFELPVVKAELKLGQYINKNIVPIIANKLL